MDMFGQIEKDVASLLQSLHGVRLDDPWRVEFVAGKYYLAVAFPDRTIRTEILQGDDINPLVDIANAIVLVNKAARDARRRDDWFRVMDELAAED